MPFEPGHKLAKGGARPGAGRKSDKDLQELQRVMAEACPYDERVDAFRVMVARAKSGDAGMMKLLFGYLYGTPVQRMQDENGGAIIRVFRVDDRPATEAATPGAGTDTE